MSYFLIKKLYLDVKRIDCSLLLKLTLRWKILHIEFFREKYGFHRFKQAKIGVLRNCSKPIYTCDYTSIRLFSPAHILTYLPRASPRAMRALTLLTITIALISTISIKINP